MKELTFNEWQAHLQKELTNMTPKEKATELLDKFIPHTRVFHEVLGWEDYLDSAKQCALIAVDETSWILNEISHNSNIESEMYFYQEVKQEIEKL